MPKYDGVYAIKKIKFQDPKAKILALTGYKDYKIERGLVNKFLYKPYNITELVKTIAEIIGK